MQPGGPSSRVVVAALPDLAPSALDRRGQVGPADRVGQAGPEGLAGLVAQADREAQVDPAARGAQSGRGLRVPAVRVVQGARARVVNELRRGSQSLSAGGFQKLDAGLEQRSFWPNAMIPSVFRVTWPDGFPVRFAERSPGQPPLTSMTVAGVLGEPC